MAIDASPTKIVAIVDDDDAIRPALARLIRTIGYRVHTFASAEALLGEIDVLRPACVLTDVQMPGMNGVELVRELRRRMRDLPIMVMTAYPSLANRALEQFDGPVDFTTKPLDDSHLESWLARVIGEPLV